MMHMKQAMKTDNELPAIEHLDRIGKRHLIENDGRVVCWREFGAGTPLVLLHGGHGSWLHWIRNIEALSASHRVLVPDLPGYGESDELPVDSDFSALVDALVISIDKLLGVGARFDLAGFSFGSVVAGRVAVQHKGVRKLALLGAVGHGLRRRPSAPMLRWHDIEDEEIMLANMRHNLGVLMMHGPIDPLAFEIHRRSCVRTRYQSKRTSMSPILSEALEQLEIPVLILWGEHDSTGYPDEVGPIWQGAHADRSYHVIRAAGHWVQYEAADEINRHLLDWFSLSAPALASPDKSVHCLDRRT
jgi:pimeloyl-ACP methyl ester carboxylesterase